MTRSSTTRLTGAALAAALLALPAAASAHPQVYTTTAKVVRAGAPTPPTVADLEDQTRYAIGNDGYTAVLRESNGVLDHGYVNYLLLPGAYRSTLPSKDAWLAPQYVTGVQPHATCGGIPALETTAAIRSWQDDPFYDYVPWQTGGAGFGDDPEDWIPVVKSLTGVDLDDVVDPAAACVKIGGTYHPADAVQSSSAAFSSAVIADAIAPLTDQVAVLQSGKTAAEAAAATARATATATATDVDKLKAEVARLTQVAAPLTLAKPAAKAATVAKSGLVVTGKGPAGLSLRVRLLVSDATAASLKLKSRVLGTASLKPASDGAFAATLTPSKAAATALTAAKATVRASVDAAGGDRTDRVSVSLGK